MLPAAVGQASDGHDVAAGVGTAGSGLVGALGLFRSVICAHCAEAVRAASDVSRPDLMTDQSSLIISDELPMRWFPSPLPLNSRVPELLKNFAVHVPTDFQNLGTLAVNTIVRSHHDTKFFLAAKCP
jgi:hypothetical protein